MRIVLTGRAILMLFPAVTSALLLDSDSDGDGVMFIAFFLLVAALNACCCFSG